MRGAAPGRKSKVGKEKRYDAAVLMPPLYQVTAPAGCCTHRLFIYFWKTNEDRAKENNHLCLSFYAVAAVGTIPKHQ